MGLQAPVARGNSQVLPAGNCCCCMTLTVDECTDWLQHCLMNI